MRKSVKSFDFVYLTLVLQTCISNECKPHRLFFRHFVKLSNTDRTLPLKENGKMSLINYNQRFKNKPVHPSPMSNLCNDLGSNKTE